MFQHNDNSAVLNTDINTNINTDINTDTFADSKAQPKNENNYNQGFKYYNLNTVQDIISLLEKNNDNKRLRKH